MGLKWGGLPPTTRRRSGRRLAYSLARQRARRGELRALRQAVQAAGVVLVAAATIGLVWYAWASLAAHAAHP